MPWADGRHLLARYAARAPAIRPICAGCWTKSAMSRLAQRTARYQCVIGLRGDSSGLRAYHWRAHVEGTLISDPRAWEASGMTPYSYHAASTGRGGARSGEKNSLSHRGQALRALVTQLQSAASSNIPATGHKRQLSPCPGSSTPPLSLLHAFPVVRAQVPVLRFQTRTPARGSCRSPPTSMPRAGHTESVGRGGRREIISIFLGGGTPSLFSPTRLPAYSM